MMKNFCERLTMLLIALITFNPSFHVIARRNAAIFRGNTLTETEVFYRGTSAAQHARMLVHNNVWATLSTFSVEFQGIPFGHTVSYSGEDIIETFFNYVDLNEILTSRRRGLLERSINRSTVLLSYTDGFYWQAKIFLMVCYGIIASNCYSYNAGDDLSVNSTASVSISKAQEGKNACILDVEDPTCWKITLLGTVEPVPANQRHYAEKVLFSKHPDMKHWPNNHRFWPRRVLSGQVIESLTRS
ncbi:FMN-binding split barrel [Plasmopara halstedii]|uniref:FMN-binding split barrel n=1 Tax=Plasmopara halstedii TaxID=4781 RepID=A0A0N7L690_PLAHL|nr:FMN-binding split barrel [Plasmopara halstedii]CEG43611.1 FMN-binding split barrel [Plasmopara halstedii]|eukprot:XP_024579980.1 FMN-binding split barrel [Plasmopara halstedii]